jgi:hypothetical protein
MGVTTKIVGHEHEETENQDFPVTNIVFANQQNLCRREGFCTGLADQCQALVFPPLVIVFNLNVPSFIPAYLMAALIGVLGQFRFF